MTTHVLLESVGYLASALIAVSLMMSSLLRLRIINLIGAAMFSLYGFLIHAYPVAVLNGIIVGVNLVYLLKMLRQKEFFRLLKLKPDSEYLAYFLKFHAKEINHILSEFNYIPREDQLTLFILRDCAPVGVFIAEEKPDGVLRVVLDFVIPHYRDLKIGRFLFVEEAEFFRARGVKEIVIDPRTKDFGTYLQKVGFESVAGQQGSFRIRYAKA